MPEKIVSISSRYRIDEDEKYDYGTGCNRSFEDLIKQI